MLVISNSKPNLEFLAFLLILRQVWGPATIGASSAEIEEDREDSKRNDAAKCEDEAYKADNIVGVEKGGRWHAAAFVAFGVYMCGSSMPWLPFQPTNKFDVAQVWCSLETAAIFECLCFLLLFALNYFLKNEYLIYCSEPSYPFSISSSSSQCATVLACCSQ